MGRRQLQGANGRTVAQTRHTRKPLIPSSTTSLSTVLIRNLRRTLAISRRAALGSMQGTKKDLPLWNFFQLI